MKINLLAELFATLTTGQLLLAVTAIILVGLVVLCWPRKSTGRQSWRGGPVTPPTPEQDFRWNGQAAARKFMSEAIRKRVSNPQDILDTMSFQLVCMVFLDYYEFSVLREYMMEIFEYCPEDYGTFLMEIDPEGVSVVPDDAESVLPFRDEVEELGGGKIEEPPIATPPPLVPGTPSPSMIPMPQENPVMPTETLVRHEVPSDRPRAPSLLGGIQGSPASPGSDVPPPVQSDPALADTVDFVRPNDLRGGLEDSESDDVSVDGVTLDIGSQAEDSSSDDEPKDDSAA